MCHNEGVRIVIYIIWIYIGLHQSSHLNCHQSKNKKCCCKITCQLSFLNKMHTFANIKILGFSSFAQTFWSFETFLLKSHYGWVLHKINKSFDKPTLIYPCSLLKSLFFFFLWNLLWWWVVEPRLNIFLLHRYTNLTTRTHIKMKETGPTMGNILDLLWESANEAIFSVKIFFLMDKKDKLFALTDHH